VVDINSGAIAQRLDYEFGNVLSDSAPGFQPFGFQSGLYDNDSGFVQFGARWFDPHTGRWFSKDSLLLATGWNVYTFCGNDPISFMDPWGLFRFGKRPLGSLPRWTMSPSGTLADLWNIQTVHEQGFFEDGSAENIGLDRSGPLRGENPSNYILKGPQYDDDLMREAMQNADFGEYSLIGQRWWKFWEPGNKRRYKNNCQDYADRLREEYECLKKEYEQEQYK
jgi:RHS repeat-associated protein